MQNISINGLVLYLDTYINKFKEPGTYYWTSTLKNAENIFF